MDEYIQKTFQGQCQYNWFQIVGEYERSQVSNPIMFQDMYSFIFNTKPTFHQDVLFKKNNDYSYFNKSTFFLSLTGESDYPSLIFIIEIYLSLFNVIKSSLIVL